jgi:hypothetical protein
VPEAFDTAAQHLAALAAQARASADNYRECT